MAILETFVIFGLGAWVFHKKILLDKDLKTISKLVMEVFFPLLTFATIAKNFNRDSLNELWIMPLGGFLIMFISFFIGMYLKRFMHNKTRRRLGTFHHICTANNYVFLPIIVLENIYSGDGGRHVALLLLMNVGATVGLWTVGIISFVGGTTFKRVWERVWSVNIIAVIVAVVWSLLPWKVPTLLWSISDKIGSMAVPLMLVLIGGALYQCYDKLLDNKFDLFYLSFVRLLLIPLIMIFILNYLPIPQDMYDVFFIVSIMPAASSSVIFAKQYGGSDSFAGQVILATTILSLGSMILLIKLFLE